MFAGAGEVCYRRREVVTGDGRSKCKYPLFFLLSCSRYKKQFRVWRKHFSLVEKAISRVEKVIFVWAWFTGPDPVWAYAWCVSFTYAP